MKVKEQNARLSMLSLLHLMFIGSMGAAITEFYKSDMNTSHAIAAFSVSTLILAAIGWMYSTFFKRNKKRKH